MTREEKVTEALELFRNTPNGCIKDSDTVLKDIIDGANFEETGLSEEIFNIWLDSSDRESVEALFYTLAHIEFNDYVKLCIRKTTRNLDDVSVKEKLYPLMRDDEQLAKYSIIGEPLERYCIVPRQENFEIITCIETTLRRLIEGHMEKDIYGILGAKILNGEEMLKDNAEYTLIDLGYAISGEPYCFDMIDDWSTTTPS